MKNIIKTITEIIPHTTLPDGYYNGLWSGYVIEVKFNGKIYELTTEVGVKGINIKVIIEIENGVATFDLVN